jgi:hypothetical protein
MNTGQPLSHAVTYGPKGDPSPEVIGEFATRSEAAQLIVDGYAAACEGIPIMPKDLATIERDGGTFNPSRAGTGHEWKLVELPR